MEKGVLAQSEGSRIPQVIRGPWKQQSIQHQPIRIHEAQSSWLGWLSEGQLAYRCTVVLLQEMSHQISGLRECGFFGLQMKKYCTEL